MKKKSITDKIFYVGIFCLCFWIGTTMIIQRCKCPEMTETQLFFNTFNYLTLNFKECHQITIK